MPQRLNTTLEPTESEIVVRLEGPLDLADAAFLREFLDVLATTAEGPVVLDLARLHALDSVGLGVLIGADRQFRDLGRELRIRSARGEVLRILELSGASDRLLVDA